MSCLSHLAVNPPGLPSPPLCPVTAILNSNKSHELFPDRLELRAAGRVCWRARPLGDARASLQIRGALLQLPCDFDVMRKSFIGGSVFMRSCAPTTPIASYPLTPPPPCLPLISTRRRRWRRRSAQPGRQGGKGKWHREGSNQISLMKCILAEVASVSAGRSCLCASLLRGCVTVMESSSNAANETVTLAGLRFVLFLFMLLELTM